jgi:hypothetical protein
MKPTGVRSPTEAEDFSSSLCVQTGSGAHPVSYPMGTGVLSQGVKRGRGVMLTTHPHLVLRLSMSRSYTSSPPCASMACSGTAKKVMKLLTLWNFLQRPVTSSLLGPNIHLSTLFPNTINLCSSLNVRDEVSHQFKISVTKCEGKKKMW